MAFNFGGATPGPAPSGAPFAFGSTTPAPAPGQPSAFAFGVQPSAPANPAAVGGTTAVPPQTPAAPATTGGFSFGGSATPSANAPAGAPTPSFTFGSTAANTPAPGTTTTPAAPATAFNFGGAPTTTTTPAAPTTTATATTAAPATGFSFGGTPAVPAASGTSGFGGFSTTTTPGTAAGASGGLFPSSTNTTAPFTAPGTAVAGGTTAGAAPRGPEVPDFHVLYPNEGIFSDLRRLLAKSSKSSEEGREAASEIADRLRFDDASIGGGVVVNPITTTNKTAAWGKVLCAPKPLQYTLKDENLRNQLRQSPFVVLSGNREAELNQQMLEEVFKIADDLRVSEREALVLFAEANKASTRAMLEEKLAESIVDKSLLLADVDDDNENSGGGLPPVAFGTNVVKAAQELYFYERQRGLQAILLLAQSRIEAPHKPWGDLIIQATDGLLQNKVIDNLIKLIRDWTGIIFNIEQELLARITRNQHPHTVGSNATTLDKKKMKHFDMVHLAFAKQERQRAAEALFYLSYQTQFEATEVASLIDLIRDITNGINEHDKGLPCLDPFRDVPSAYEVQAEQMQPWATYHQSNIPPPKERKHLEWERLFVRETSQTSLPALLRCVSTLVVTVISAMDTKQVLIDRNTHGDNNFGKGNNLSPPGDSSTRGLEPIESRLKYESVKAWKRTDICGLLCGAYAMLRSAASQLLGSPRAGGSSPSKVLARQVGNLLSSPMALKSISFARLCLLPALQRPSLQPESLCDSSEFMLSVLSDFVASFIDILSNSGNLPGSRAAWKIEQEEALKLQREQQKQQREFQMWSGNYQHGSEAETPVPTSVNIMDRPDCMDDIITLAVHVARLGPEFSIKFWATTQESDGTTRIVPSKTLKRLKTIIAEDESLTSFYYAFLAALSTDKTGADVVNSILASPEESRWHWNHVLETLRWYFRQFDRNRQNSNAAANMTSGANSTSYYYRNVSVATSNQEAARTSSKSQPLPLGQENTFWILSLLGLLDNAARSPSVRLAILTIQLPIRAENNSVAVLGNDSTLTILFSLLTAPVTPEIRGAITKTISSLLSMEGMETAKEEDKTKMCEFCSTAWELVESCQILPIIAHLDQYPPTTGDANRATSGLQFPASSTSLAGSGGPSDSMIPVDKSYAILFEMEHVESHAGVYPSTEGFLCLLNSLFSSGCPETLGRQWRLRTGCSPYIEYVVHFVIPRATGSVNSIGKLPFRSKADEARLVALALQVVESVLVRYSFSTGPPQRSVSMFPGQPTSSPTSTEALVLLGHPLLAEKVVETNTTSCTGSAGDFENKTITYGQFGQPGMGFAGMQNQGFSQPYQGPATSSIPAPKSPGFIVLANILSVMDSELMLSLSKILKTRCSTSTAIGISSSKVMEAYALFKELLPTTSSAKHAGKTDTISSSMRRGQLQGLRPGFFLSSSSYSESVSWQERSVIHALQILCAAVAREEKFYTAVNASLQPLRIVPTVRFNKRPGLTAQINTQNVHLARLSDLVLGSSDLVKSIVEHVGHGCSSDDRDVSVAMSGLSLMHFIDRMLPASRSIETILGRKNRLSTAMARRLSVAFERCDSIPDSQILSLVLNWILSDLRQGRKAGLAHALFAVPENDTRKASNAPERPKDSLGAILEMLNDYSFILNLETSGFAAMCFEIIEMLVNFARIQDPESLRQVVHTMKRLREAYFWRFKLEFFLSSGWSEPTQLKSATAGGNPNLIHAMAFFLKGVASELHMLSGFSPPAGDMFQLVPYVAPQLQERNALLAFLFGLSGGGISNLVKDLPISRLSIDSSARMPPREVIRCAMKDLQGSMEVVSGYKVLDLTLLTKKVFELYGKGSAEADDFIRWGESWNMALKLDCAATHLSDVLRSLVGGSLASYDSETAIHIDTLAVLLDAVLARLGGVSDGAQLSPSATTNLSVIASLLTQQVVYPGTASSVSVADKRRLRDLLAVAVVASGKHAFTNGPDAPCHQERTAILGASLIEVMQSLPEGETEIDRNLFLNVSHSLAQLSVVVERGEQVAVPESAFTARATLASLVEIWDQEIQSPNESLAYTFLSQAPEGASKTNANAFLERLSSLDDDIVTLVEELLHVPFVGDALIQQGLMKSLSDAADIYLREENRLQQSLSQEGNGRKAAIGFPSCLMKHLELFRVLFSTTNYLSEPHVRELPENFATVISKYRQVLERVFTNFSSHGEELCVLFQCTAQASTLLLDTTQSTIHSSGSPFQPVTASRSFRDSPVEKYVQELSLHLAEHPIPKEWLADLPYSLGNSEKRLNSRVVPVLEASGCSWWENFQSVKRKSLSCNFEEFSGDMFKHAILGAEILKAGLIVLMNLPPKSFAIEVSFVRGLFLLSTTARAVETQVELLFGVSSQLDFMETDAAKLPVKLRRDYLRKYGRLLNCCIQRLLLLLVGRVRMFLQEPENRLTDAVAKYCRAVSDALNYTELETQGIPCSIGNDKDRGKLLAAALRDGIIKDGSPQLM